MNLTRVLNNALPEIPARTLSQRPPKMPPDVVFNEHVEDGAPIVRVFVSSLQLMYSFPPATWAVIQLFDGTRSVEEVAELFSQQRGQAYSVEEVRDIVDQLESSNFWYKTAQEKNIQLMQISREERKKLIRSRKSKVGDLAEITFPAFNPDRFVTRLYAHSRFIYTWWFTLLTLLAFAATAAISIQHWSEIGSDTVEFFNFTHKSWFDLTVFYLLAVATMCWHELAHAHTCKHYGGRVQSMGFMLIYMTPAVYTDTTEGFVKGSRYQRFLIAMAGAWSELMICAVATPLWWFTAPGTAVHAAAYQLMLMTGIAGVLLNWNPLMKLDGYHMLGEVVEISNLKEDSTAYVSGWVKKHIWHLPVEVPYVPKKRRLGYAVYALLSGAYSYTVLYVFARFVGNIFRNFNPEWSFIPELTTAALLFKSRIRTLVNFMKFVYLDKKDRIEEWFHSRTALVLGAVALLLLILPIWRDSLQGRFILEALTSAEVRNVVPGIVSAVYTREGAVVSQGTPVIQLTNSVLESSRDKVQAEYKLALIEANSAAMRYVNLGSALKERSDLAEQVRLIESKVQNLEVHSPIAGIVLTPRLTDKLGTYLPEGTPLAEIADLRTMRARVYVPEYDMHQFQVGEAATLQVDGTTTTKKALALAVSPVPTDLDPALVGELKLAGLKPPKYFLAEVQIPNDDGKLRPGMMGNARIYADRKSAIALVWKELQQFFGRKFWVIQKRGRAKRPLDNSPPGTGSVRT